MSHQVEVPTTSPDDLGFILGTHMAGREKELLQVVC